MCFIIAMICLVFAYNFFMAGNILGAVGSLIVAIVFIFLMSRNILHVKRLKKEKKNDN